MSHPATNTDIMQALDAMRAEMRVRDDEQKKIAGTLLDHERRLLSLEPLKDQVIRMGVHLADISAKVTATHELLLASDTAVTAALRIAASQLAGEVTGTVRAELSGIRDEVRELREQQRKLTEEVAARPCISGAGDCPR